MQTNPFRDPEHVRDKRCVGVLSTWDRCINYFRGPQYFLLETVYGQIEVQSKLSRAVHDTNADGSGRGSRTTVQCFLF